MTESTLGKNALTATIIALRRTLARAMVDATTACQDLENDHPRAAVGAVIPIGQALNDAQALLNTILILNRNFS